MILFSWGGVLLHFSSGKTFKGVFYVVFVSRRKMQRWMANRLNTEEKGRKRLDGVLTKKIGRKFCIVSSTWLLVLLHWRWQTRGREGQDLGFIYVFASMRLRGNFIPEALIIFHRLCFCDSLFFDIFFWLSSREDSTTPSRRLVVTWIRCDVWRIWRIFSGLIVKHSCRRFCHCNALVFIKVYFKNSQTLP